jgi:cellulose synthase operon protein C
VPEKSQRISALAARVDALKFQEDDEGEGESEAHKANGDRAQSQPIESLDVDIDDVELVESGAAIMIPPPMSTTGPMPVARITPVPGRMMAKPPGGRPPPLPPRPPVVAIPPRGMPALGKPPAMPPRNQPVISVPPIGGGHERPPTEPPPTPPRTKTAEQLMPERSRRPSAPPPAPGSILREALAEHDHDDHDMLGSGSMDKMEGGVEVGTIKPAVVIEQTLEEQLQHPTVVEIAIAALGDAGGEVRAQTMTKELDALVLADPTAAATLAYELGELYERRLTDEARAVKAYGRALGLDPSLRPNLWAIRRVFYRRALWPNLVKLIDAEVGYARDDYERADLLLEKARISAYRMKVLDEARIALDEAVRIAPTHQGALLELERVVAKTNDTPALLDVWERLAEAVEQPARKIAYWLEVGRVAGRTGDIARAQEAFGKAAELATNSATSERIARERLRVVDEAGAPAEISTAIDALSTVLLGAFGPAGPGSEPGNATNPERSDRATALRHELVALRRRQAQLVRAESPDKAWELLQQATALAPGESIVLSDLTELAEELGRYDDLAELVQTWQAVEADPSRGLALSIRRADALLRGGQRDEARALLASLEATAPGFIVLASAAERDALSRGDAGDLAKVYLAAANASLLGTWLGPGQPTQPDPAAAAALYIQGAELLAYDIGTPEAFEEAHGALGKALEAVPGHPGALEALTELDDSFGQVEQALTRLRGAIAAASEDTKRPLLERAIRLARSHGDLEAVLAFERELVALVPTEPPLKWRLESTLSQLGKDDERAELLVTIAADEAEAGRRGTALFAAARLRERAGAVEAATELYRQVLVVWPDDTFARESLVDLLRAQERWSELVAERRAEAKSLPDGPAVRRALREAAWVLEVRLDDAAQAARVYDDWLVRVPDDRAALEGQARTRARLNDRNSEVAARAALAEGAGATLDAQYLHGRALERAALIDEAADVYRNVMSVEEPAVAATAAALALGDLAAMRGDTVMRVESTAALAGKTTDPRLGSALAEDSGWMYALVLEDFDRAAQSFEAAIALDGTRKGAHLGAALVAARRGDALALAAAFEGLAAIVQMPEAAAALLLRSSAMAAANGDLETANARVAAARIAAPDDTSALLVIAETAAAPQVDAGDAFAAVDPLLARAEILEMRAALADDPAARASWELDRAEALELAGRLREAGVVVAGVLKTDPDDLRALASLRRMANRAGDKGTVAQASFALARVIGDAASKLSMLRDAAKIFDGPGLSSNTDYAVAAYKRIVMLEPGAPELDRLLDLLRERADVKTLISVVTERLIWLESEGSDARHIAMAPLLLERATVLHGLGDQPAAMGDLDVLLDGVPNHVEALRFRADLALTAGDVVTTIALWRRYLTIEKRPQKRGEIELQLSQVLAEQTGDVQGAIEQLERVVEANPEDTQLRERLLGLCMRVSDWERAIRELRQIIRLRPTQQEKSREELRLAQLLRDKISDRVAARLSLDRARALDPLNLDVVRELADMLEPAARAQMLLGAATNLRAAIVAGPSRGQLYERLAQINAWQADVDARWVALVAVEALATPTVDQRQVLAQGRQQLALPNRVKLDDLARAALRGGFGGPLAEVWRAIAPTVQAATGVDIVKLGFTRGDKIAVKKLGDKYQPVASVLASFGIEDVDIYISAGRSGFARALAGDTPILCLGADVAAAALPQHRFALGRAVASIAEGVATLSDLHGSELEWTLVAALKAADVAVPAALAELVPDQDAAITERAKALKKMSRKARNIIVQLAQQKPGELADVEGLRRTANAVGQRAGLVWCGDLAVALAVLDVGKGGRTLADSPTALELVAWSVSEDHMKLREKLGISLKGNR